MQYLAGFNYLTKSQIKVIDGPFISKYWLLTNDGISGKYAQYLWTPDGLWYPDWKYTANI